MSGDPLGWERPPADIVEHRREPLTQQRVDEALAMVGQQMTVTEPGEPIYGADGSWIGMTEPESFTTTLTQPLIDTAEARRLGFLKEDNEHDH